MKINSEQWNDLAVEFANTRIMARANIIENSTGIMQRLTAIEQSQREESKLIFNAIMGFNERVKVIEQGQGILCERLDALNAHIHALHEATITPDGLFSYRQRMEQKLDCLQGKELLAQFKAKPKRRKKR